MVGFKYFFSKGCFGAKQCPALKTWLWEALKGAYYYFVVISCKRRFKLTWWNFCFLGVGHKLNPAPS